MLLGTQKGHGIQGIINHQFKEFMIRKYNTILINYKSIKCLIKLYITYYNFIFYF